MSTSRVTKYGSVFNIGLQNTFVYRWNYFLRALFGLIPLAGTVFLWAAVFKERGGGLHGYDYGSRVFFYFFTILVGKLLTPTADERHIGAEIREEPTTERIPKANRYLANRCDDFSADDARYQLLH